MKRVWTTEDDRSLRALCAAKAPLWEMAIRLRCCESTVRVHIDRLGIVADFGRRYKPGELGAIAYAAGMTSETWASIDARLECPHGGAQQAAKRYQRRHELPELPSKRLRDLCPAHVEPLLGTMSDRALAERFMLRPNTVLVWRQRRGIAAYSGVRRFFGREMAAK